jgi:hypothetical protein
VVKSVILTIDSTNDFATIIHVAAYFHAATTNLLTTSFLLAATASILLALNDLNCSAACVLTTIVIFPTTLTAACSKFLRLIKCSELERSVAV